MQEIIHLLEVKKKYTRVFVCTHIIPDIREHASVYTSAAVSRRMFVHTCVFVCVKRLILGNGLGLSLVVDEWLGVRSWLRNCRVPRLYNVFTTQTDSYTTAYYWPSKPPRCTVS